MTDKHLLVYPGLFSVFPILFLYAENTSEVRPNEIILPILCVLLFVITSLFVLNRFVKNIYKTSFLVFIFLLFFYAYGHLHYFIEGKRLLLDQRYFFLFYACLLFSILVFLFRATNTFRDVSKILFPVTLLLFILQIFNIVRGEFGGLERGKGSKPHRSVANIEEALPDIYHIVLDGYASNSTLKEIYNYDNSEFADFLTGKGFVCPKRSIANYESTIHSLSSTLNFEYHVSYKNSGKNVKALLQSKIENNKTVAYLHSKGYRYVHVSSGFFPTNKNKNAEKIYQAGNFNTAYFLQLCQTTMLKAFRFQFARDFRGRALKVFQNTENAIREDGPKFVFMHVLLPHPPFVFDSVGKPVKNAKSATFPKDWHEQAKYIDQLKYTNSRTREIVTKILENSRIPPVIIIHGDHGSYSTLSNEKYSSKLKPDQYEKLIISERMRILLAIYSGNTNCALYDSISLVNVYPVLLNCIFNEKIKLSEDKSYISGKDVTDKIYF